MKFIFEHLISTAGDNLWFPRGEALVLMMASACLVGMIAALLVDLCACLHHTWRDEVD